MRAWATGLGRRTAQRTAAAIAATSAPTLAQSRTNGLLEAQRLVVEPGRWRVLDDHLRGQAFHERAGEARVDGRDQSDPVRRQARAEHGHRSEEHTSELQSRQYLVCRLLLEKKNLTYYYCLY